MPILIKALSVVPVIVRILKAVGDAAGKDSPGGKRITLDEVGEIVQDHLLDLVKAIFNAAGKPVPADA